jgi:hypothetical protein
VPEWGHAALNFEPGLEYMLNVILLGLTAPDRVEPPEWAKLL